MLDSPPTDLAELPVMAAKGGQIGMFIAMNWVNAKKAMSKGQELGSTFQCRNRPSNASEQRRLTVK